MSTDEYQVLDPLSDDEYESLKRDIESNGVEIPIAIDEDGHIIDGHHRVKACDELGITDYPTKEYTGLTDEEKRRLAWKLNMQRRHLSNGSKRDHAKAYLREDWDGEETQQEIADLLGVSQYTVSKAKEELAEDGGKNIGTNNLTTQKSNHERIREYIEEHPDESNRSVADALDVSHPTVGVVRDAIESLEETIPEWERRLDDEMIEKIPDEILDIIWEHTRENTSLSQACRAVISLNLSDQEVRLAKEWYTDGDYRSLSNAMDAVSMGRPNELLPEDDSDDIDLDKMITTPDHGDESETDTTEIDLDALESTIDSGNKQIETTNETHNQDSGPSDGAEVDALAADDESETDTTEIDYSPEDFSDGTDLDGRMFTIEQTSDKSAKRDGATTGKLVETELNTTSLPNQSGPIMDYWDLVIDSFSENGDRVAVFENLDGELMILVEHAYDDLSSGYWNILNDYVHSHNTDEYIVEIEDTLNEFMDIVEVYHNSE